MSTNVFDVELGFINYNIYRNDRNLSFGKTTGGGVLIAIKKKVSWELLTVPIVAEIEQIFLKITFNNIKMILGCVYIPPDTSSDVYSHHCNTVESIYFKFPEYNFVITGDFNLNTFDWSVYPNSQNHKSGNILYNTYINFLKLKQCNSIINCIGRTLDCIMLSDQAELTSIYLSDSLVPSIDKYHPPIEFLIKFKKSLFSEHLESPYIFNFKKFKFNEITQFLSYIDFDLNLDNNLSLDAIINKFHEIIYHSFNLFVPKTKIYNNYFIVWSNAELRNLIIYKKCRKCLWGLSS